jgi:hypothetical protein
MVQQQQRQQPQQHACYSRWVDLLDPYQINLEHNKDN